MHTFYLLEPQFLIELAGLGVTVSAWLYATCARLRQTWPPAGVVGAVLAVGAIGQLAFPTCCWPC